MMKLLESNDMKTARALLARGYPYHRGEETLLTREIPDWRAKLREAKERGETFGPSRDPEQEEVDQAVTAEFGAELAKAEQAVAAAVARTSAVVDKVFAGAPRVDPSARGGGRWFSIDELPQDLRTELRDARQAEESARVSLSRIHEKIRSRRYELAGKK